MRVGIGGWGEGGGGLRFDFFLKSFVHMVLTVNKFSDLFDLNFICSKTAGICGMNLRSTTVVYFFNECSPTEGDPSKQGKQALYLSWY